MQGFYTVDETANKLGVSVAELNQLVQQRKLRAFEDGGSWRFRIEEVNQLLQERAASKPPELFPFSLDETSDQVDIFSAPEVRHVPPGSDSDVRLVPTGSDINLMPSLTPPAPATKPPSSAKLPPPASGSKLAKPGASKLAPKTGTKLPKPAGASSGRLPPPTSGTGLGKGPTSGVGLGKTGSTSTKGPASGVGLGGGSSVNLGGGSGGSSARLPKPPSSSKLPKPSSGSKLPKPPSSAKLPGTGASTKPPSSVDLGQIPPKKSGDSDIRVMNLDATDVLPIPPEGAPKKKDSEVRLQSGDSAARKGPDSGVLLRGGSKFRPAPAEQDDESTMMIERIDLDAELQKTAPVNPSQFAPPSGVGDHAPFELTIDDSGNQLLEPTGDRTPAYVAGDTSDEMPKFQDSSPMSDDSSPADSASEVPSFQDSSPMDETQANQEAQSDFELTLDDASGHSPVLGLSSSEMPGLQDSNLLESSSQVEKRKTELGAAQDSENVHDFVIDDEPAGPRTSIGISSTGNIEEGGAEFELTIDDSDNTNLEGFELAGEGVTTDEISITDESNTEVETQDFSTDFEMEEIQMESDTEVVIESDVEEGAETEVRPSALDGFETTDDSLFEGGITLDGEEEVGAEEEAVTTPVPVAMADPEWGVWSLLNLPTALVMIVVGFLLFEMVRSTGNPGETGPIFEAIDSLMK